MTPEPALPVTAAATGNLDTGHTPPNRFRQALREGPAQIGLWLNLGDGVAAEICAGAGFDWLLIDMEHTAADLRGVLQLLQTLAAYPVHPVVRIASGEPPLARMLLKQVLDLGATTVLVPMVDSAAQAAALAAAVRYPAPRAAGSATGAPSAVPPVGGATAAGPPGVRGMAGARGSRWGRWRDQALRANDEVCLLLQAETVAALEALEAIAATDGVHGVFIGPADLSASMGHPGNPGHPEVQAAIADAIARIVASGKAAGILDTDPARVQRWLGLGARFVAVGLDTAVLAQGTRALADCYRIRS